MKTILRIIRFICALPLALILFVLALTLRPIIPAAAILGIWALLLLGLDPNVE